MGTIPRKSKPRINTNSHEFAAGGRWILPFLFRLFCTDFSSWELRQSGTNVDCRKKFNFAVRRKKARYHAGFMSAKWSGQRAEEAVLDA